MRIYFIIAIVGTIGIMMGIPLAELPRTGYYALTGTIRLTSKTVRMPTLMICHAGKCTTTVAQKSKDLFYTLSVLQYPSSVILLVASEVKPGTCPNQDGPISCLKVPHKARYKIYRLIPQSAPSNDGEPRIQWNIQEGTLDSSRIIPPTAVIVTLNPDTITLETSTWRITDMSVPLPTIITSANADDLLAAECASIDLKSYHGPQNTTLYNRMHKNSRVIIPG